MNCKNCGHPVDGNFCTHCGQKSSVTRVSLSSFLDEISTSVFQINRGFFFTLIQLSLRPGKVLKEYLDGRRKRYFKPIAYLLILSTLYLLSAQATNQNTLIGDLFTGWFNRESELNSNAELPEFASWLLAHYPYLALIMIPVFSLASFVAFYKFDKNYLEHLLINSYITGHQAIIYSLFVVLGTITDSDLMVILSLSVAVLYNFWVFIQLFSEGHVVMNIMRVITAYFIYAIISAALMIVLLTINK